jgi:alkylation response protein AidB-like acyl-CoA dehydrogenase
MPHDPAARAEMLAIARSLADQFSATADQYDRAGTLPLPFYDAIRASGYLAFVVPTAYGGRGANLGDMVRCQEILAQGCGSTAMAVDMTVHVVGRVAETRSYPEAVYAAICRDIVADGALINAVASEKDLGSPSRGGLPATTATWDGTQWRINGQKLFVSMGPLLRYLITMVSLPVTDAMPHGGTANAVVRGDASGLSFVDSWGDALSLRSSGSGDVVYTDVPVPDDWLIERKSAAATSPAEPPTGMAWFALTLAGVYLGIGQAAIDCVARYANTRVPTALGKPIAALQTVQQRIGAASIPVQAARALLYEVADAWSAQPDQRMGMAPRIAAAKYAATNAALVATDQALRIAGGFGITRDLPLERFFRDARAGITHPPNDDAALELVGKAMLAAKR